MREWKMCHSRLPGAGSAASVLLDPIRRGFVHRRRDDDATMGKTEWLSYLVNEINHF
jgi:hypothetical protein